MCKTDHLLDALLWRPWQLDQQRYEPPPNGIGLLVGLVLIKHGRMDNPPFIDYFCR